MKLTMTTVTCPVLLLAATGTLGLFGDTEAQVLEGATAGDQFGWSVAPAGDVNNDGLADLLVGIPYRDQAGQDAGEVHLYLGVDGTFPSTPALVIPGQSSGDAFGYAVSSAGDVNMDGFDDFLVGAPGRSAAALNAGRVYLFLGGSTPDGTPDQGWDGSIAQARFGAAVAGGFQFNGDDRSDFAVGAPGHNGAGISAGRVRIFLGSATGLATETYVIDGDQANWGLGFSLDPAGDVNNDGLDDLVAGAPQLDQNPGQAVVWFGQSSNLVAPSRLVFTGEVGTDQFGWDVSGAGDVNGDGIDDLLVGAPHHGADNGAIYMFHGGDPMNNTFDWKASGGTGGDLLGTTIDGGFDISADNIPDIASGAPGASRLAAAAGEVLIFYGKTSPEVSPDTTLVPDAPVSSTEAGDGFGTSLSFVGSLDGHAGSELAVGAPLGNGSAGAEAGYLNLITHPPDVVPVTLLRFGAARSTPGVELTWEVADASGLAGLRVSVGEGGTYRNLHQNWLRASTRSFLDPAPGDRDRSYRLSALSRTGEVSVLGETRIAGGEIGLGAPDRNPFRDQVRFRLSIPVGGNIQVVVSDIQGRRIRTLMNGYSQPGAWDLTWDGRDEQGSRVPPGMYVIWSRVGNRESARKVLRLP